MFKQFFSHWNETDNPCAGFGRSYAPGSIAEWNIEDLHADNSNRIAKSAGAAIGYLIKCYAFQLTLFFRFMPDDGLGEKNIWRVEDMDLVEVRSWWKTTNLRFLFSRLIVRSMDSSLVETPM